MTSKHKRFNLRQLNLPPLNKDHSRSLDNSCQNVYKSKTESSKKSME